MNPTRKESATPIGDIVAGLISATERDSVLPLKRVQAAWARLAASGRLAGTRVNAYKSGTAIIEVKSPPLCAELAQFRRRELVAQLRTELAGDPPLEELKFRLAAW